MKILIILIKVETTTINILIELHNNFCLNLYEMKNTQKLASCHSVGATCCHHLIKKPASLMTA